MYVCSEKIKYEKKLINLQDLMNGWIFTIDLTFPIKLST